MDEVAAKKKQKKKEEEGEEEDKFELLCESMAMRLVQWGGMVYSSIVYMVYFVCNERVVPIRWFGRMCGVAD